VKFCYIFQTNWFSLYSLVNLYVNKLIGTFLSNKIRQRFSGLENADLQCFTNTYSAFLLAHQPVWLCSLCHSGQLDEWFSRSPQLEPSISIGSQKQNWSKMGDVASRNQSSLHTFRTHVSGDQRWRGLPDAKYAPRCLPTTHQIILSPVELHRRKVPNWTGFQVPQVYEYDVSEQW